MNLKVLRITLVGLALSVSGLANAGLIALTDFNSGNSSGSGFNFPRFDDGWGQPDGDDSIALNAGANGIGDHAAFVQLNGGDDRLHFMTGENPGFSSTSPYSGDYNALNVENFSFDFKHGGLGSDLSLRVHLWDNDNNLKAVTNAFFNVTANDTSWQTFTFSLKESDLIAFGNGSITGILDNVTGISIRNTIVTTGGPGSANELDPSTSYYFDNMQLTSATDVPEPSTYAIFAIGMLGLVARRLKK